MKKILNFFVFAIFIIIFLNVEGRRRGRNKEVKNSFGQKEREQSEIFLFPYSLKFNKITNRFKILFPKIFINLFFVVNHCQMNEKVNKSYME